MSTGGSTAGDIAPDRAADIGDDLSDLLRQLSVATAAEQQPRTVLSSHSSPVEGSPSAVKFSRVPVLNPPELALTDCGPVAMTFFPPSFFQADKTCQEAAVTDWDSLKSKYSEDAHALALIKELAKPEFTLSPVSSLIKICDYLTENTLTADDLFRLLPIHLSLFPNSKNNPDKLGVYFNYIYDRLEEYLEGKSFTKTDSVDTKETNLRRDSKFFGQCLSAFETSITTRGIVQLRIGLRNPNSVFFEIQYDVRNSQWKKLNKTQSNPASASAAAAAAAIQEETLTEIPQGKYSLVILKHPSTEQYSIRLGQANHIYVAHFKKSVAFAGEIEIDDNHEIISINNRSGGFHITGSITSLAEDAQHRLLAYLKLPADKFIRTTVDKKPPHVTVSSPSVG